MEALSSPLLGAPRPKRTAWSPASIALCALSVCAGLATVALVFAPSEQLRLRSAPAALKLGWSLDARGGVSVKAHDLLDRAGPALLHAATLDSWTSWWTWLLGSVDPLSSDLLEYEKHFDSPFEAPRPSPPPGGLKDDPPTSPAPYDEFPFWRFLPAYLASLLPGPAPPKDDALRLAGPEGPPPFAPPVTWDLRSDPRVRGNACFSKAQAKVRWVRGMLDEPGVPRRPQLYLEVEFEMRGAVRRWCVDHYLVASGEGVSLQSFQAAFFNYDVKPVVATMRWAVNETKTTAGQLADLEERGLRLFLFTVPLKQVAASLLDTAAMFVPMLQPSIPQAVVARNLRFFEKYVGHSMVRLETPLTKQDALALKHTIKNGDMFGVARLDGLDPMLAWSMGSTTGHQALAMWEGEELYVYEATASNPFWPRNGIQKNTFEAWLEKASRAEYNLVHVPLSQESRQRFDSAEAMRFFNEELEGLDYGYNNMVAAWIDTLEGNYPCLPPDYTLCIQTPHVEVIMQFVDAAVPRLGQKLFAQALAHRVGRSHSGIRVAEALHIGRRELGLQADALLALPEQDGWLYNTTKHDQPHLGLSRVCCTTVCSVWKAGGVFGDLTKSVNCAELTTWDVHSSRLFDPAGYRQILGAWDLRLNQFNSRPVSPHFGERCPSKPPHYAREPGC